MPPRHAAIARRALLAAPALLALPAHAQSWPNRPIRLIVPFGPGGPTDICARILAQGLSPALGQPVVIENRGGAGGNIGVAMAARAVPDGHTLLIASSGFVVNPSLFRNPGYDPVRDFAPITELGASPDVFLASIASPIRNLDDLVARARATEGGLHFANPGTGSTPHLAGERLAILKGLRFVQVTHSSAALTVQSVLVGTTEIGATALASSHAQIQAGRVRAIALTGPERWFDLPEVPTMVELGHADFISETFLSSYAPAGTPQPVIDRLAQVATAVMGDAETRGRMRNAGFIVRPDGPAALAARVAREVPAWRDLITRAGIMPE
ncbi:Bug family tripartite tricarboxylate transporter substrate binding protein [Plastoroseomonas arctica]|uniref:Tripartite tricarboxylate transporter substrate binding protein n=1 Tax=Plastoroseomonas arctica TaxID=1509237 RepID=A0AAF1JV61_9PROT|nr:tripartite tricarboxylate transporter substrate binding protein [Plastoroseomonas arctica]MBR0653483.1 tripartite tricarboxylate transporter substrate binding protein [Plastoroseomonas arctica]